MVRHKDFGAPVNSDEPITFTLYGKVFRCVPAIQGRTLLRFISVSSGENAAESAGAILDFFDTAVVPEDLDMFREMTSSLSTVVPLETLAKVMEWMVEEYSGRPTPPPSPSDSGELTTGPMPVVAVSSAEVSEAPAPA